MNPFLVAAVMTKDEPEALRLICRLAEQKPNRIIVLDDFSSPEWMRYLEATIAPHPIIEIARHHLNDHFAEHRNFVKTIVPADHWLVFIDSDEWIAGGFIPALRDYISCQPGYDAIMLDRCNTHWAPGSTVDLPSATIPDLPQAWRTDWQPRVFLNKPQIRYVNRVHEELVGHEHLGYLNGPIFTLRHHQRVGPRRYAHIKNE